MNEMPQQQTEGIPPVRSWVLRQALEAAEQFVGRSLRKQEINLVVSAVNRLFDEPTAPTTRLQ